MTLRPLLVFPLLCAALLSLATPSVAAQEESQTITPLGTYPATQGKNTFTGQVRIERLIQPKKVNPFSVSAVTFEPGARTYWHRHVAGQHLLVVSGIGLTGTRDGKVVEIKAGDVVWCPPNVMHWHGASPTTPMTHLALTNIKDGQNTEWFEAVSDAQYNSR